MKKYYLTRVERFTTFVVLVLLLLNIGVQIIHQYQMKQISMLQENVEHLKHGNRVMQDTIYSMRGRLEDFMNKWDVGVFEATAYSPYDDRNGLNSNGNPDSTATGTKPGPGTIAVNFKTFSPRTKMWVQGYGWGKALDTGGDMIKNPRQIDLFKWTYPEAMQWGRRQVVVVWKKA